MFNGKFSIKAIIFDLDDTLYPEKAFIRSGFRAVSNYLSTKYNLSPTFIFKILWEDFEKGVRRKNFDMLLERLGINDTFLCEKLVKIYREHFPDIQLDPRVKRTLEDLHSDFKLALITDGHPTTQKNKIEALGLKGYFDIIKINDITKGEDKTNIAILEKIIHRLKEIPSDIIFVGDNPLKDFAAPRYLGLHTVRIIIDDGLYSHIKGDYRQIDYTIYNLREVYDVIQKIEGRR